MVYIWVFQSEFGDNKYFANSVTAYSHCRLYLKMLICGDENIALDELDEDTRESFRSALDELAHSYSDNRTNFGVDGMFDVRREEVLS